MNKRKRLYFYFGMLGLGLIGGYGYWHFWGCTDSCPLWFKWELMLLRGGVLGLLLAAILDPWIFKKNTSNTDNSPS